MATVHFFLGVFGVAKVVEVDLCCFFGDAAGVVQPHNLANRAEGAEDFLQVFGRHVSRNVGYKQKLWQR